METRTVSTSAPFVRKYQSATPTMLHKRTVLKMRLPTSKALSARGDNVFSFGDGFGRRKLLAGQSKTPLPAVEFRDRRRQIRLGEIGPEHRGENEFGIGG